MKILLTGGSGFIGGALLRYLERQRGLRVDNMDIRKPSFETESKLIKFDLANGKTPQQEPYDLVFHCAGLLGSETLFDKAVEAERVNVLGTLAVVELQKDYGLIVQTGLIDDWLNVYMISKRAAERYGLAFRKYMGVQYQSVRMTHVYGPRQSTQQKKIIPTFVCKALCNEPIPVYGDGSHCVNLLYVDDAAEVVARIALDICDRTPLIDIASVQYGNEIPVRVVAEKIVTMTGSTAGIKNLAMRRGQPSEARRTPADLIQAGCIFDQLDFSETSLEDGLAKTIAWYRSLL